MSPSTASIYKQHVHFGWSPTALSLQRLPWPFSVHWFANHGLLMLRSGLVARIAWAEAQRNADAAKYTAILVSIINATRGLVIENKFELGDYVAGLEDSNSAIDAYLRVVGGKASFHFSDSDEEGDVASTPKNGKEAKRRRIEETRERMEPVCDAIHVWLSVIFGGPYLLPDDVIGSGRHVAPARAGVSPHSSSETSAGAGSRLDVPTDELPIAVIDEAEHEL